MSADDVVTDGEAWVARYWSADGPHTDDQVTAAAAAIAELTRYLNHATRSPDVLALAPTLDAVVGQLATAAAGWDQLLQQLAGAATRHSHDPALYDDRRDRPAAEAALAAAVALENARAGAAALTDALELARTQSSHLGHEATS